MSMSCDVPVMIEAQPDSRIAAAASGAYVFICI
jgi:hypothetical protein